MQASIDLDGTKRVYHDQLAEFLQKFTTPHFRDEPPEKEFKDAVDSFIRELNRLNTGEELPMDWRKGRFDEAEWGVILGFDALEASGENYMNILNRGVVHVSPGVNKLTKAVKR